MYKYMRVKKKKTNENLLFNIGSKEAQKKPRSSYNLASPNRIN